MGQGGAFQHPPCVIIRKRLCRHSLICAVAVDVQRLVCDDAGEILAVGRCALQLWLIDLKLQHNE